MASDLYSQLGEKEGLEAVVGDFYERVLDDDQLRPYFDDVDMDKLRAHQVLFLGTLAGGDLEYDGRDMEDAHADLDITGSDFEAVAGHLQASLEAFDVDEEAQQAVLEAVTEYQDDIVGA